MNTGKKIIVLGALTVLLAFIFRKRIAASPVTKTVTAAPAKAAAVVSASADTMINKIKSAALPYYDAIIKAEKENGIPKGYLYALLETESNFRPEIISGSLRSKSGAVGIAQFLPSTAADELGLSQSPADKARAAQIVTDPAIAIPMAAKYLAKIRASRGVNNWQEALGAYNQGAGTLQYTKSKYGADWLRYFPAEGQNYMAKTAEIINRITT